MLRTLARNRISIERTSNEIIETITPTTLDSGGTVTITTNALNAQRTKSIVSVSVIPAPSGANGIVRINGTDNDGNSQTENISIPVSGVAQGDQIFRTVTDVVLLGDNLNNCAVTVRYVGRDGGSIKARRMIAECIPAQISRGRGNWYAGNEGTVQTENLKIAIPFFCTGDTSGTVREGDCITDLDTGAKFIATGAPLIQQVGISRFYDVSAQRYQGG